MAPWTLHQDLINAANHKFPGIEPGAKRKDRPRTISVFSNTFVENYLAKAHWITPGVVFAPVATYGLYRGLTAGPGALTHTLALFPLGILVWTLIEYLLHRFVFHGIKVTEKNPQNYLVHEYHHDFPDDGMRLVMPVTISGPIGVIFAMTYHYLLGPVWMFPMLAGSAVGYTAYDWIHYYTHHGRPKTAVGKYLRRYHLVHHFTGIDACYGVSSPLWDLVFGTYKPSDTPDKPSA
ncbi:MAG: sterol desaturase family protein [Deltaproteobacteria bacterium]